MPTPANLVHQTTTGTGTGNLTLSAVNGKQSFATAFGTGVTTNVFDYFISNQSAAEYERGTGHMSDATTLVRDTVIESTNANAAVSFSAGTKDIANDVPAAKQISTDQAATQTQQEAASVTTAYVSPGTQFYNPGHVKALYAATITPTAVSGSLTSITANVILWSTTHGLTTGDTITPVTNAPTGTTNLSPYYINASDTTHFSLHLTLADALAGTNKVAITTGGAMTMRKLVYSTTTSYNMSSVSPITGVAATAAIGFVANLGITLSSTNPAPCVLNVNNLVDSGSGVARGAVLGAFPSTFATTIITYANANINMFDNTGAVTVPGTWSQQGTTAYKVFFILWGDL